MGGSSEKAASVGSKLKKCLRRIVTAMSRDLRPQDLQRSSIRSMARTRSADDLAGAAAAAGQQDSTPAVRTEPAPRRHSDSVFYVPFYAPYASTSVFDYAIQQQQLAGFGAAQQDSQQQQQRQRQPRQKLFSPGTLTALQQVLPAVPTSNAVCGGSPCWSSAAAAAAAAAGLAYRPADVTRQTEAPLTSTETSSSAAAAASSASKKVLPLCSQQQWADQVDDSCTQQQLHTSLQQQQHESPPEIVPVGWLGSVTGSSVASVLQKLEGQHCKRHVRELVAVGWLDTHMPCSIAMDDLRYEPEQPDTPTAAAAAGVSSSEQRRWYCKEHHSSAVLFAVPAAASGELIDSLAALPLVNPYATKATAAVAGVSSWQGWQSGHQPHMLLTGVDWD